MTFEEFVSIYKKYGKCPGQMSKPGHTLNERELKTRYEKYSKPKEKKVQKGSWEDPKWKEVADIVWKRDRGQCRLLSKLKIDNPQLYVYFINNNLPSLYSKLDLAHIIPRSQSSELYYEPTNIVLLSRPIHSNLDSYHNPITGISINKIQHDEWWEYIIGNELWRKLNENI